MRESLAFIPFLQSARPIRNPKSFKAARDALAQELRLLFDERLVERQEPTVAHHYAPLYDDRAHLRGLRRVDEMRVDVVARRLVQGVEVNDYDVGALRLRTVATKDRSCADFPLKDGDEYDPAVILDLDYWVLMPT